MKITFLGAGSTVFLRNVLGDCMCSEALRDSVFALYDIDAERLKESQTIMKICALQTADLEKSNVTVAKSREKLLCAAQTL